LSHTLSAHLPPARWSTKTLTIEEQARVLRQLIERVGYDARGDKVKVTYNSNGIRGFCKEAIR
jgi:hypothetical protein